MPSLLNLKVLICVVFKSSRSLWYQSCDAGCAHSDETGTVFDLSVFYEDGIYKMYGSWRPNGSISYTTSRDGFTWDQMLTYSLSGEPNHDREMGVNRPFVLKRTTGEYIRWYSSR